MMIRICHKYNRFYTYLSILSAFYFAYLPLFGNNGFTGSPASAAAYPLTAPDQTTRGRDRSDLNLAITSTPVINTPICNGATQISGTLDEADGTEVTVFRNLAVIGKTTVHANAWTLTVPPTLLVSGNSITATALAAGKDPGLPSAAITVSTQITATIIGSTETCQNSPDPIITFTGFNGERPYTFTYSINGNPAVSITTVNGNSAIVTVPTDLPGTYTYTLLGVTASSCSSTVEGEAIVSVRVNAGIGSVTAENSPICSTATTTLTANDITGTEAMVTWWTGRGGTGTNLGEGPVLTNAGPGTYYVNVRGVCGMPAEASVTVESIVLNPGTINTNGGNYCVGGNTVIGGSNSPYSGASGGLMPYTYQWEESYSSGTNCNPNPSPAAGRNDTTSYNPPPFLVPGTYCYRRKVTDACGTVEYTQHTQFNVYPDPKPQTIVPSPNSISVCAGTDVSATFTGGSGGIVSNYRDIYIYGITGSDPLDYTPASPIPTAGLPEGSIITILTRRIHPPGVNGCSNEYKYHQWTVLKTPANFNLTGGGKYCLGDDGVDIGLDGSEGNTVYQLYREGVSIGAPITGTGSSISFGKQTTAGTYTVVATNTETRCTQSMTGPITVTVNNLPVPAITGDTGVCEQSTSMVYNTEPGMTGYAWTISPGGIITSGINTHEITVSWISPGPQTLSVSYTDSNGCPTANPTVTPVNVTPLPATSPIYHN